MREDYTSVSVLAVIDCNTESAPVNNSNRVRNFCDEPRSLIAGL